jgi:hypothetical protein
MNIVNGGNEGNSLSLDKYVRGKNLSENGFYIKSIDLEFNDGKTKSNIAGSVRFEKPDKYLITLRSKTGIEFARIYLNRDSIFILDRLKHKVYRGPLKYVNRNYGFPAEILAVIFGDFIGNCTKVDEGENKGNIVKVKCLISGVVMRYELDREKGKAVSASVESRLGKDVSIIRYEKYKKENNAFFPEKIVMTNDSRKLSAVFRIRKIECPWNDKVEFNIDNRYEILELL